MPNFEQIVDKLNAFLVKHGLPKISGSPADLESLYGSALKSVWNEKDMEKRENLAFAIAGELRKLFGGKNLEDIYDRTKAKLDAAENAAHAKAASQTLEDKKKDPNYIPSFDELFGKK